MTDGATRPIARTDDPYALLGVPRDASPERIRLAYEREVARATRSGAMVHTVDLSRAFDILSEPSRRALFDRHGLRPVRERSPGAAPLPPPGRRAATAAAIAKDVLPAGRIGPRAVPSPTPRSAGPRHRTRTTQPRRVPALALVSLGVAAGVALAAWVVASPSAPAGQPASDAVTVRCEPTASGPGFSYRQPAGLPAACPNGAVPQLLP